MQVGQDQALVEDDHAGTFAIFDIAAVIVVDESPDVDHDLSHQLGSLRGTRGNALVLQRVEDGVVDVFLGHVLRHRPRQDEG